jgi:MSHA biogenesis protein MshG
MPHFAWQARSPRGDTSSGTLEAPDARAAAAQLVNQGMIPLKIAPTRAPSTSGGIGSGQVDFRAWLHKLNSRPINDLDIQLFSRQMYTLMKSGVPILQALEGLRQSSDNPNFADMIGDLRASLESGRELSASMRKHPKAFSQFYVSMIQVGEMTGRLDEVFMRLFEHLEFERDMRERVKAALRYPTFVIIAMAVAITVINVFVIPAFAKVFTAAGATLPLMTRILIGFSDFTVHYWPMLIGGAFTAAAAFRSWIRTERGRLLWDRLKLRLPIAGPILTKATLGRFARSFALAQRSGVPVITGLTNVAMTVDNAWIAKVVMDMRDGVSRGDSILKTAHASKAFTPVVLQMIAVGEETGDLDGLMQEIADMYQREVDYELKGLSAKIEPILVVFLGILVLILALGVFLPIWDLSKVSK